MNCVVVVQAKVNYLVDQIERTFFQTVYCDTRIRQTITNSVGGSPKQKSLNIYFG